MDKDLIPVLSEFGAAVHSAQILEYGLGLLQSLIAVNQNIEFSTGPKKAFRMGNEGKTLGEIFKAVKEKEFFTSAEEKEIWGAINLRNDLVHSFLVERGLQAASPKGRIEIVAEVAEVHAKIRKATEIVDFLIDKYLAEYNTSIEDAKAAADELWESGSFQDYEKLH